MPQPRQQSPYRSASKIHASALDSALLFSLTIGESDEAIWTCCESPYHQRVVQRSSFSKEDRPVLGARTCALLESVSRSRHNFDLQEVFYVDSIGEDALRILSRIGARLITDSAYRKDLCQRLRLHRFDAREITGASEGWKAMDTGRSYDKCIDDRSVRRCFRGAMLGLQRVRDPMLVEELLELPVGTLVVGELQVTKKLPGSSNQ